MRGGMAKDVQPGTDMGDGMGFGRWQEMRPGGGRGFRPDYVPDADKLSAPDGGDKKDAA